MCFKKISIWLIMGAIFAFLAVAVVNVAQAQDDSSSTPTPDPMVTLHAAVATQKMQIDDLTHKVNNAIQDQQTDARDFGGQFNLIYAWVGLGSGILVLFGWKSLQDIRKDFREKIAQERDALLHEMRQTFEKELYQLDLSNLVIYIHWRPGMDKIRRRLELSGFYEIKQIGELEQAGESGVVIVSATREEEIQEFLDFIQSKVLDPRKVAFILYTSTYHIQEELQKKVTDSFENLTIANLPATVVSSILVVGRGLKPD